VAIDWAKYNQTKQIGMALRNVPKTGIAALSAALIAPALISNDDRGYGSSAAITTPIIAAAYVALPRVSTIAHQEAAQYMGFLKDMPRRTYAPQKMTYEGLRDMAKEHAAGKMKTSVFNKAAKEFYQSNKSVSTLPNQISSLEKGMFEAGGATDLITPNFFGRRRYLENAVHAEALRSFSAADAIAYGKRLKGSMVAPQFGMGEIENIVRGQIAKGNEPFIKAMNFHIQKMKDMKFSGETGLLDPSSFISLGKTKTTWDDFNDTGIRAKLKAQRPDLYEAVQERIKTGYLTESQIKIVSGNDALNPILGLEIKRGKKARTQKFSMVQEDGKIIGGKNWNKVGVARNIGTNSGIYKSDIFGIQNMHLPGIQAEVNRANIINGVDQLDGWTDYTPQSGTTFINGSKRSSTLISNKVVMSDITGFGDEGNKGFKHLSDAAKEEFNASLRPRGLAKISQSMNGVYEDISMLDASFGGLQSARKQNPLIRMLTKDIHLEVPDKYAAAARPYAIPNYITNIAKGEALPLVGVTEGGILPAQKNFFDMLPNSIEELHTVEKQALQHLQDVHGLDARKAKGLWKHLSGMLSTDNSLDLVKRTYGAMGDGSKVVRKGLYGMSVVRNKRFEVHEDAISGMMPGDMIRPNQILGFNGGNALVPEGAQNYFVNSTPTPEGTFIKEIQESMPFGKGAGIDLDAGTRGQLSEELSKAEQRRVIKIANAYNIGTGSAPALHSDVKLLGLYASEAAKGDPIFQTANILDATHRHMQAMGQTDLADKLGPMVEEMQNTTGLHQLTDKQRIARFEKQKAQIDEMFESVGARMRKLAIVNPAELNETGRNFAATKSGSSWAEFIRFSENPSNMGSWRHTAWNAPQQVKVTQDMLQGLHTMGDFGIVNEIQSRMRYDGDPTITAKVADYMNGDKSAITQRVGMREAMGGRAKNINLRSHEGRAGSVFAADSPLAKDNYIMEFPDGSSVPVIGQEGYGGRTNRFENALSATDRERHLLNLAKAHESGADAEKIAELQAKYTRSLEEVTYGKKSFLRTPAYDGMAQGGSYQGRESTLLFEDGTINPNQTRVSEHFARNVKDKELSEALLRGEPGYAVSVRYPISDTPKTQIIMDKTLNKNEFGVNQRGSIYGRADLDGDTGYLYPLAPGGEAEAEAIDAVHNKNSLQNKAFANLESQEKELFDAIPSNDKRTLGEMKTLDGVTNTFLGDVRNTGEIAKQRLVSSTIGQYSNTQNVLNTLIEQSPTVVDPLERKTLRDLMFNIYQSPISADKAQVDAGVTLQGARTMDRDLNASLDMAAPFSEFKTKLNNVLSMTPKSVQETAAQHEGLLQRLHEGRSQDIIDAARAKTASMKSPLAKANIGASVIASDVLPYSGTRIFEEGESTAAKMSAEALGAANEFSATAKRVTQAVRESGIGRIAGIGLGVAAIAGLLTTTVSTKKAKSGNNFRPEVTGAGQDQIPGQGVEGSYSSNPPKTRVSNDSPSVSRAYVAPINQSTDIEVNMKTDDPSRATETAKLVARSAGSGNTTVTSNYNNNNLTSLRNKQKLRERLDENS
jgi:hypothetical protein